MTSSMARLGSQTGRYNDSYRFPYWWNRMLASCNDIEVATKRNIEMNNILVVEKYVRNTTDAQNKQVNRLAQRAWLSRRW
jgi:hypothetical protein